MVEFYNMTNAQKKEALDLESVPFDPAEYNCLATVKMKMTIPEFEAYRRRFLLRWRLTTFVAEGALATSEAAYEAFEASRY